MGRRLDGGQKATHPTVRSKSFTRTSFKASVEVRVVLSLDVVFTSPSSLADSGN